MLPILVKVYLLRLWKLCVDGGQRNQWCQEFWDLFVCLASKVGGYTGTMADSDARGSEKPEDSESGLKRLEAMFIKLAQEIRVAGPEESGVQGVGGSEMTL